MRNLFAAFRLSDTLILALGVAILVGLAGARPAMAQEACFRWDTVLATKPPNVLLEIVPDDKLAAVVETVERGTGRRIEGATRAFVAISSRYVLVSVEVAGCLLPPHYISGQAPVAQQRGTPA